MPFVISTDPTQPPTRVYACGHRRRDHSIQSVLAVFTDRAEASKWCDSANAWYGESHPLYPVTIVGDNILIAPQPFPDLRARTPLQEAPAPEIVAPPASECYGCINPHNACEKCKPRLDALFDTSRPAHMQPSDSRPGPSTLPDLPF